MITKSDGFGNCGNKIYTNFGENAFDQINKRGNYRIASLDYNSKTGELTITQNPDVSKTVIIGDLGEGAASFSTSHKDVTKQLLDWSSLDANFLNSLDAEYNYVIYNKANPEGERYLYYYFDKVRGEWDFYYLEEGDEFYNIEDDIKYRYINNSIVNTIDVKLKATPTFSEGKSTGIAIETSPSTSSPINLNLVNVEQAGLMSPEDKKKLDKSDSVYGASLDLGNAIDGKIPLFLRSASGAVISSVKLDQDNYISSIEASIATSNDPNFNITSGDRILIITLNNGTVLKVSLENWFVEYVARDTDSITTSITSDGEVSSKIILDNDEHNLTSITNNGVVTKLLWDGTGNSVGFKKGNKESYSASTYQDKIYFSNDSREILLNGIPYGIDLTSPDIELVKRVSLDNNNDFKVINSNSNNYIVTIPIATSSTKGYMSTSDKIKLDSIEKGAEVNTINGIKLNGNLQTIGNDTVVDLDLSDYATISSMPKSKTFITSLGDEPTRAASKYITDSYVQIPYKIEDVNTNNTQSKTISILGATETEAGLLTAYYYKVLKQLVSGESTNPEGQTVVESIDSTGTPSATWQLFKYNNGPKIKNSGGQFELRNSNDDTYADLTVKNLTITGNVTQEGESFISQAETVEVTDNTLKLNNGEVGAGVTRGYAGLEIDRGSEETYKIYFDESDDRFKAGAGNDLWAIMLRDDESQLTDNQILLWDATTKRAKTGNTKYIPLTGTTLENPITGSLVGQDSISLGVTNHVAPDTPGIYPSITATKSTVYINSEDTIQLTTNNLTKVVDNTEYKVWSEDNDGENSGLDADTLDGKQASEFATSTDLDSYLPLSAGSSKPLTNTLYIDTQSNDKLIIADKQASITWGIQTLNGELDIRHISSSGNHHFCSLFKNSSGSDSLSIDCLYSSSKDSPWIEFYSNSMRIGYDSNNEYSGNIKLLITKDDPNMYKIGADGTNFKIWDAQNDGPDSGLDADLLDGKHATDFLLKTESDSRYVNIEGDTMIGKLTINGTGEQFLLKSSDETDIWMTVSAGSKMAHFGYHPTYGAYLQNGQNNLYLGIKDDGTPHFNGNTLWHSGNDGAGSGLDADLLDGHEATDFLTTDTADSKYYPYDGRGLMSFDSYGRPILSNNQGYKASKANGTATVEILYINTVDNVVVGGPNENNIPVYMYNTVTSAKGFYDTSDKRLKSNIKSIDLKDPIKLYEFNKNGKHSYGVIAQEVEESYPSVVSKGSDGYKTVNYNEVLSIKCAELERENKELKNRLDMLEEILTLKGIL